MRSVAIVLAAVALPIALQGGAAEASPDGEAQLRRRVQRFHVLSYLNRHSEMWDLFAQDLRERLGDDRQEYVRSARDNGFELYSSRVDSIELRGSLAIVDVTLQAQLAGALQATMRRHRMLWRLEDGTWLYAGSLDVTASSDPPPLSGPELAPPASARAPEVAAPTPLLPPRVPLGERAAKSERPAAEPGQRWDLVGVPPPGSTPDSTSAPPAREPAVEPAPAVQAASAMPADAELLPPQQLARAPEVRPAQPPGAASSASRRSRRRAAGDEPAPGGGDAALLELVRRASGSGVGRARAAASLRTRADGTVASAIAATLAGAPPASQIVFLDVLARVGRAEHAAAVVGVLESPDAEVRQAALGTLGRIGDASHATGVAAAVRDERLVSVRGAAAVALGRLGGPLAGRELAALLASEQDPSLLADAARGVAECACLEAEPALLDVDARRTQELFEAVADAAGRLGAASAERLREWSEAGFAWADDPTRARVAVLRALARAGAPGSGVALARGLIEQGLQASSSDAGIVAAATDDEALLTLLEHPHPAMRRQAAELLARTDSSDDTAARRALEQALRQEGDSLTASRLSEALERLGSRKNESTVVP